tara:strand:+ start:487 stop:675 length:189 start_codon:yes stop_codon:yes gene_type:complete
VPLYDEFSGSHTTWRNAGHIQLKDDGRIVGKTEIDNVPVLQEECQHQHRAQQHNMKVPATKK